MMRGGSWFGVLLGFYLSFVFIVYVTFTEGGELPPVVSQHSICCWWHGSIELYGCKDRKSVMRRLVRRRLVHPNI